MPLCGSSKDSVHPLGRLLLQSRHDVGVGVHGQTDLAEIMSKGPEEMGIASQIARSGESAIQVLGKITPDLVVIDIGLPDMDGIKIAHWLRRQKRAPRVPILIYNGR